MPIQATMAQVHYNVRTKTKADKGEKMSSKQEERKEVGRLAVTASWDADRNTTKTFSGSEFGGDKKAILFPSDATEMDDIWKARFNPSGVPLPNTEGWSMVVTFAPDKTPVFMLRDREGICREIPWGHCHHAIEFDDWESYDAKVAEFYKALDGYKIAKEAFKTLVNGLYERGLITREECSNANSFSCHWTNNMSLWVDNYHAEKTRVMWSLSRLALAQAQLQLESEKFLKFKDDTANCDVFIRLDGEPTKAQIKIVEALTGMRQSKASKALQNAKTKVILNEEVSLSRRVAECWSVALNDCGILPKVKEGDSAKTTKI